MVIFWPSSTHNLSQFNPLIHIVNRLFILRPIF